MSLLPLSGIRFTRLAAAVGGAALAASILLAPVSPAAAYPLAAPPVEKPQPKPDPGLITGPKIPLADLAVAANGPASAGPHGIAFAFRVTNHGPSGVAFKVRERCHYVGDGGATAVRDQVASFSADSGQVIDVGFACDWLVPPGLGIDKASLAITSLAGIDPNLANNAAESQWP